METNVKTELKSRCARDCWSVRTLESSCSLRLILFRSPFAQSMTFLVCLISSCSRERAGSSRTSFPTYIKSVTMLSSWKFQVGQWPMYVRSLKSLIDAEQLFCIFPGKRGGRGRKKYWKQREGRKGEFPGGIMAFLNLPLQVACDERTIVAYSDSVFFTARPCHVFVTRQRFRYLYTKWTIRSVPW